MKNKNEFEEKATGRSTLTHIQIKSNNKTATNFKQTKTNIRFPLNGI